MRSLAQRFALLRQACSGRILKSARRTRVFGNDSARLAPDERRALFEQLHRYESFTYVIDMMGRAAIQACERALQ